MTESSYTRLDPRLERYGVRDGLAVYIVDGAKIRATEEGIDFTDGASHEEIPKVVPQGMIYLDQDAKGPREYRFTLADVLAIRDALRRGRSIEEAWKEGARVEAALRKEAFPGQFMDHKEVQTRQLGTILDLVPVFLLDGMATRTQHDPDFVQGGNSAVYKWTQDAVGASRAVMVDNSVFPKEWPYIILHEGRELDNMTVNRMTYVQSHRVSNRVELRARQSPPVFLQTALDLLHWKPQA